MDKLNTETGEHSSASHCSIFELVDTTNEETYFTMGLFQTLEDALAIANNGTSPPPMEIEDDLVLLEVRERPIGKIGWSELGEVRAKVRWVRKFSEEDEDDDGKWIVSLSNSQAHPPRTNTER
jgi:hypothetical protein